MLHNLVTIDYICEQETVYMAKNKEYYRIALNIKPFMCESITYTATISEPFEEFIERNESSHHSISVIFISKCDEEDYEIHRQFNPGKETHVKLLKRDSK